MNTAVELDPIDVAILHFLSRDGRRSFTDMAESLGTSVGMIRNRYNRLVDQGILHIIGWTDPVKNGMNAYARLLLQIRPSHKIRAVAERLTLNESVSFVALTSGNYDIEINVTCRNNEALLRLIHEHIHTLEGVYETHTTMYLEIWKWAAHPVKSGLISASMVENYSERASDVAGPPLTTPEPTSTIST